MSNIKKVAAIVSVFAIGLLIYTISTFKNSDIPTSGTPSGHLYTTSGYVTTTEALTQSATSDIVTSAAVSLATTVPAEESADENKTHIIVPFSKEPVKVPPPRIEPVPVVTPANIVFKSIPLVCHDTQPSEEAEENDLYEEVLPQTESEVICTEPPVTDESIQTSVITPSVETTAQTTPNILNE